MSYSSDWHFKTRQVNRYVFVNRETGQFLKSSLFNEEADDDWGNMSFADYDEAVRYGNERNLSADTYEIVKIESIGMRREFTTEYGEIKPTYSVTLGAGETPILTRTTPFAKSMCQISKDEYDTIKSLPYEPAVQSLCDYTWWKHMGGEAL